MTGITITRDERERAAAPRAPARAGAQERGQAAAAELIADFKNQMGQEYAFDQDEVWEQATKAAEAVVAKSQAQVHARCRELKIPDRFAPNLRLDWHHRGYGNALESRRNELRIMAETQIEAIEQKAVVQMELSCLKAQEQLALGGLTSDAAKRFIESCPVCGGVDSDVAEVICRRASHQAWRAAILRNGSERRAIMAGDDEKRFKVVEPGAELTDEQLDEDERALRALRIDLPGTGGAPSGIISMAVTNRLPKKEFFRCHPTNTVVVPMVDHVRGMDVEYNIVAPSMVAELASIDIDALPYRLWQILTVENASIIIPVRQADLDGNQNSWNQTKETALIRAQWLRVSSDRPNGRYRAFEAPPKRFADPVFPDLSMAKIIRLAFTDRGRLIDSPQHPLFLKWAGRDAEK